MWQWCVKDLLILWTKTHSLRFKCFISVIVNTKAFCILPFLQNCFSANIKGNDGACWSNNITRADFYKGFLPYSNVIGICRVVWCNNWEHKEYQNIKIRIEIYKNSIRKLLHPLCIIKLFHNYKSAELCANHFWMCKKFKLWWMCVLTWCLNNITL